MASRPAGNPTPGNPKTPSKWLDNSKTFQDADVQHSGLPQLHGEVRQLTYLTLLSRFEYDVVQSRPGSVDPHVS